MRTRGRVVAVALALAASIGPAAAQTLYKWTDKDGKVQYSDKPPTNFKGEVTRIEADVQPVPVVPRAAPATTAKPQADADAKPPDLAAKRRAERERLAARVSAARAKLEQARAQLTAGEAINEDEKQFVQQYHPRNAKRPELTPPPRQNCMVAQTTDGTAAWNCPVPVPGEAYFARQKTLEEAVQKAEEELAEAERAYRRGVD